MRKEERMKTSEMVKATIESGVTPITFDYERVIFFGEEKFAMRSFMVINSLDLGTLTYKQYRFVARRTRQGNNMVERHVQKIVRLLPSLIEANPKLICVTIPVYARLLKDGELAKMLFDTFSLYPEVPADKICIELSADILFENVDDAKERIDELRALGVKIAICEGGDEFCPVFRLAELAFDYAFLDDFATDTLDRDDAERVAGSLVKYLKFLNVKVIAPSLKSEEKISGAKNVGCDGYTLSSEIPLNEGEEVKTDG
jgi:EAL domain-containing protein (putative c-di-GMP-specific phosphodiesterase class I)